MTSEEPCNIDLTTQLRMQVLAQAQELLHNQYVEIKTQLHNSWVHQAELAWRMGSVRPPYPKLPTYPDPAQVLQAADHMWHFVLHVSPPSCASEPITSHDETNSSHAAMTTSHTTPDADAMSQSPPDVAPEQDLKPEQHAPDVTMDHNQVMTPVPKPLGMMPSWLLRKRDVP